jgi:hypothetical protein
MNGIVFEKLPPSLSLLRKRYKDDAALWHARLPLEHRVDVDLWLLFVVFCPRARPLSALGDVSLSPCNLLSNKNGVSPDLTMK